MLIADLKPKTIIRGPVLPEPVEVIVVVPMGDFVQVVGRGLTTGQAHSPVLSKAQVAQLQASSETPAFDGDARLFRLGIEAICLGLAYEYDPYFSLSISRVDPLPHQIEAVYDYFLKLPRIRFLLADDPGAGKTIMAGLLIKELKLRGLVKRILIVTPANLTHGGRDARYGGHVSARPLPPVPARTQHGDVRQAVICSGRHGTSRLSKHEGHRQPSEARGWFSDP